MRRQLDRDTRQFVFASQFPVHVGIDGAKGSHTLVARGPDGIFTAPLTFPVGRAGFDAAATSLHQAFPAVQPERMLVGIEFAGHHGVSLAHDLHGRGCHVVAVLAKSAKQTRDGSLSGRNKTDRIDAKYICVTLGRGTFVRYPFLRSPIAELKPLVMARHRLTIERARLKNRIQGLLDLVWPEFAGHFSSVEKAAPQAILRRWSLPQDLLSASPRTVRAFIAAASRGKFKADWTRAFLASARTSVGLRDAPAERRLELEFALARKDLLDGQIAALVERITQQVARCPEARLLLTVPEVSAVCAATIVAELGDPATFEHPGQWLKLAGLHLEGRQSGQMDGRSGSPSRGGRCCDGSSTSSLAGGRCLAGSTAPTTRRSGPGASSAPRRCAPWRGGWCRCCSRWFSAVGHLTAPCSTPIAGGPSRRREAEEVIVTPR
jgi:transposase